jgi:hypothetical protein
MPGVHLTVLAGPTVAVPLPAAVTARLQSVRVTETDEERSAFSLTFDAGRSGPTGAPDTVLAAAPVGTGSRVVLVVSFAAVPTVLFDGIVTRTEHTPGTQATFTVTGEDVSVLLDRDERDAEHPGLDDYPQVLSILARYAAHGLVPMAVPPADMDPPLPIERVPTQHTTDLRHLVALAQRHGYVAYVLPGPLPGTSRFYWGPPVRIGVPQSAISVDLGPVTNATDVRFRTDALSPVQVEGSVQDRRTGAVLPVRAAASLRPPLAAVPLWATGARTQRFRDSGVGATTALARAQSQVDRSIDAVVGEGVLDAARYASVLRPRGLVGVRGAGWSHDGLWYVRRVTHDLSPGSYRQSFTIAREGHGSTVPAVVV